MNKILKVTLGISVYLLSFGITYAGLNFTASGRLDFTSTGRMDVSSTVGTIQGFSTHPPCGSGQSALDAYYDQLLAQGATWQRTDDCVGWSTVQSTSSASYVWGNADLMINRAVAKGINTVILINITPTWATYAGCTSTSGALCAPANSTVVGTYCSAVATRYSDRVSYYEVWNEPNTSGFWSPSATTTDYVAVLNSCYTAIKAVNSNNKVIFAGTAPTATAGKNISITDFVTAGYSAGATFDIMGQHPYSYPWPLNKGALDGSNNGWLALENVRRIMNTNGDTSKSIWITEVGAPTCGTGNRLQLGENSGSSNDYMSFEAQAQIAQQIVATTTVSGVFNGNSYLNIGKTFWYTLVDANSSDPSTRENCFGTYFTNGNKKQAFWPIKNS